MYYGIIGLAILINLILYIKRGEKKQVFLSLKQLLMPYEGLFYQSNKKQVDFEWIIGEQTVLIKLIKIKKLGKLIITNPKTWIVTQKSEPIELKNRVYNRQFLELSGEGIIKMVILHGTDEAVVRYVNENELAFVKPSMKIEGCHFVLLSQFENELDQVLKLYQT